MSVNYITELEANWNIMGVPHNQSVDKTDILVNYDGSYHTWDEAVLDGIVSGSAFAWDRTGQSYLFTDLFISGYAYWMYAHQECTLKRTNV